MEEAFDAVVIGAGPAGSIAARELARRGDRVLLVDRASFPRCKVCGCCLNGSALAALRRLGLDSIAERGLPLQNMRLSAGAASARFKLNGGIALARTELDQALVNEARSAGAEFRDGVTAKVESRTGQAVHIRLNDSFIRAKIAVLATGLSGDVRPGSRIGGGTVLHDAPEFYEPGTIFMATGSGGYVGLVKLADDSLDVAAAFDAEFVRSAGGLASAAAAILRSAGWPELPDSHWKGTPQLTRHRGTVAEHRLFAVGDATGYVEPFTGEGMAWAISSAAALAPIAHRAIANWNDDCIAEWRCEHARIVGRRQWLCRASARVLRSPPLTRIAVNALRLIPALARPVVAALDRPSRTTA